MAYENENIAELLSIISGEQLSKMDGKNISDLMHKTLDEGIKENSIYGFYADEKRYVIAIYNHDKAVYVVGEPMGNTKKFARYAYSIADINEEDVKHVGCLQYTDTSIENGMLIVLPDGVILEKTKHIQKDDLEKAVSGAAVSASEANNLVFCGSITIPQWKSLMKMKNESAEKFESYIKRNAKRIGYDPSNIAQEMILNEYFEKICKCDMFRVKISTLKSALTGNK
jgi:hypothetical protein